MCDIHFNYNMCLQSWGNNRLLELTSAVIIMCDAVLNSKDLDLMSVMAAVVTVIIHRLIGCAYDPQPAMAVLKKLSIVAYNTHTVILALLSDSLVECPSVYLPHLLEFCKY